MVTGIAYTVRQERMSAFMGREMFELRSIEQETRRWGLPHTERKLDCGLEEPKTQPPTTPPTMYCRASRLRKALISA